MSISLRHNQIVKFCGILDKIFLLAALRHEREAALLFAGPVPADVGMCEVVEADWFYMDHVDERSQCSRPHHFSDSLAIRGITKDCSGILDP